MKHSYKLKTIAEAINLPTPSISSIRRDYGATACESYIMLWLVYLNEMLAVSRPMSEDQISLCSSQIMNDYGYLKLTAISFIFKRIQYIDDERQREHTEFRYQEQKNETPLDYFKRKLKKSNRLF